MPEDHQTTISLVERLAVATRDFMPPADAARLINIGGTSYVVSERLLKAAKGLAAELAVPISTLFARLRDELNA